MMIAAGLVQRSEMTWLRRVQSILTNGVADWVGGLPSPIQWEREKSSRVVASS
ncbi:MAG TPA: hypothetical protein VFF11_15615 [Candidatus Binatia bacterium]|nr:hypothetical protein [Candidatus Binatia bacterium]